MAKSMAVIENNIVKNVIWCSDYTLETDELKNVYDKKVNIGDEYKDGKYYRNGELVLSLLEEYEATIKESYDALQVLGIDTYL